MACSHLSMPEYSSKGCLSPLRSWELLGKSTEELSPLSLSWTCARLSSEAFHIYSKHCSSELYTALEPFSCMPYEGTSTSSRTSSSNCFHKTFPTFQHFLQCCTLDQPQEKVALLLIEALPQELDLQDLSSSQSLLVLLCNLGFITLSLWSFRSLEHTYHLIFSTLDKQTITF